MNQASAPIFRAIVRILWDGEAAVWIATSDDIQGLVAEDTSLDSLIETVRELAVELSALNGTAMPQGLHFLADRLEPLAA
jgi:Domain of unknown function (DUF1902)